MELIEKWVLEIESKQLWDSTIYLKRNEFLKSQGACDTNVYFVEDGSLRMFIMDQYEEQTIRFGYQRNLITDLESFLTNKHSDLSIQALRQSKIKSISKSNFLTFISESAERKESWQKILEMLIAQQLERERDLLTSSPSERYKRVLKRSPQLFQEIPNKYIASYLRMTPETLSRLKKS